MRTLIFISERNEKRGGDHGADHRAELFGMAASQASMSWSQGHREAVMRQRYAGASGVVFLSRVTKAAEAVYSCRCQVIVQPKFPAPVCQPTATPRPGTATSVLPQ